MNLPLEKQVEVVKAMLESKFKDLKFREDPRFSNGYLAVDDNENEVLRLHIRKANAGFVGDVVHVSDPRLVIRNYRNVSDDDKIREVLEFFYGVGNCHYVEMDEPYQAASDLSVVVGKVEIRH